MTEVRNALRCPRIFALGRQLGRAVSFPVGSSSLGATFHRIVERIAETAHSAPPAVRALAAGASVEDVECALREWFLDQLVVELERSPALATMPAEIDDLAEALRAFAGYVARRIAAANTLPALTLARFFDRNELSIDAQLQNVDVELRGRIDAIHLPPGERYEVVEYKLTGSENAPADAAQVALYRLLLKLARGIDAEAVVLRFDPELSVSRIGEEQADALVDRQLVPLIRSMRRWADQPETAPPPGTPDLCPACPMRVPCLQNYGHYLPSRDDPPAGAPRPRPTASGELDDKPERELPIGPPIDDRQGEAEARAFEEALERVFRELGVGARLCPPTLIGPRLIRVEVAALRGRVKRIDAASDDVRHLLHQHGLRVTYERRGGERLFFAARTRSRPVRLPPLLSARTEWLASRAGRFVVGEGIDGSVVVGDLSEPVSSHLLVAGATGSGKSVLLRALVT
ncbi:MAG TPA: PD-(D/E)XK nuclease family protein, partial [Polyangiaceae bacterium]|nr:PD-(D/E)XK nuclease family protein [Polyangiaceae bacterium]